MIVIIADDLTGASDTGVKYKKNGFRTIVETECADVGNWISQRFCRYEVLSINTNTRLLNEEEAYRRVYRLTKQVVRLKPKYIYKKIDSLLRGNPAAELDAVLDATKTELALVVPSFPENRRIMIGGIMNAPGNASIDVVGTFRNNSKRKICGIPLKEVAQGPEHLREQIELKGRQGFQVLICDAGTDLDLEIIKNSVMNPSGKNILFCGSAGFAKHLSNEKAVASRSCEKSKPGKVILVVAGSRRGETAHQLKHISASCSTPIITLDVSGLSGNANHNLLEVERCKQEMLNVAKGGHHLILFAVSSLFSEQTPNSANFPDGDDVGFAKVLGETVKAVFPKLGIHAVISTGGDTSLEICNSLDAVGIELCDEISAGIPVGRVVGGSADGMTIVTKSGGFGDGDALIQIVKYLQNHERSFMKGVLK
ncbi:hypothetical protein A7X67_09485 [Clostridium sp. W14A]|nr:hypothetical protein A7X67_09485 [Clostridium sp. W14A]